MNTINNRAVSFNSRQDSMDSGRRLIGFHGNVAQARPPSTKMSTLMKLAGIGCLIGVGLISTPSPSWSQEHESKPKTEQTKGKTVTKTTQKETRTEKGNHEEGQRAENHRNHGYARNGGLRNAGEGRRLENREFNRNFGEGHRFRPGWIGGGYDAFGYGGFTFGFLEPWPLGWSYDDDVYVMDIDGGYVLCNPLYPGITVGVIIE
jgi:hypothetical protein